MIRGTAWTTLFAAASIMAVAACAHVEAPPGGGVDREAPRIVAVLPDTGGALPAGFRGPVVVRFNERLAEAGFVASEAVIVAPRTSTPSVQREGDEIRVSLARGWEPGRIYQITLLPAVQDLFQNRSRRTVQMTFSTGPAIPNTAFTGLVTDRTNGRPVAGARVEAAPAGDTLPYVAVTDSAGVYRFSRVPAAEYSIRAFVDVNRDRRLAAYEPVDTTTQAVAGIDTVRRELALVVPDSTAPRAASAVVQSGNVEVRFDDFLDPEQPLSPEQVQIVGSSGTAVRVGRLAVGALPPRAVSTAARPDSARADSTRADSMARPDTAEARATARDTARRVRPLPSRNLTVEPADSLPGDTAFVVTVRGIRNLVGRVGGGEVRLRIPPAATARPGARPLVPNTPAAPPARPDSARPVPVPPDTARRNP